MTSLLSTAIVFGWSFSMALTGCANQAASNTGSTPKQKADITKIYTQAIGEYIRLVKGEYHLDFDTLFFGKHVYGQPDDFPDIELPATIEQTNIRLIAPEQKKQKENKSLVYINLVGWVDTTGAEFIFVTFSNGAEHQFDCFINYKYNNERKDYDFLNSRFENYLYKKQETK